jgi:prolyl oligopeptidase
MKIKTFLSCCVAFASSLELINAQEKLSYPTAPMSEAVDNYFGEEIIDHFRPLENDRSEETANWVNAQNKLTNYYLKSIPFWADLKNRVREHYTYEKVSIPFKKGEYFFTFRNDGTKNQSVLYRTKDAGYQGDVLIDPNTLSADGTTSISGYSFSKDGKYFAYSLSTAGSDWNEIHLKETATGNELKDKIQWVKFSGIAFAGNGFYYSAYDAPEKGKEYSAKNQFHKVYFHQIGTSQSNDKLIYEDKKNGNFNFGAQVTEDERFLILSISSSTSGNALKIKDLKNPSSKWVDLVVNFDNDYSIIGNEGEVLYCLTNLNASNYKLVSIDLKNPDQKNWKDVIGESKDLLEGVEKSGKFFVVKTLKDVTSRLYIYSLEGKQLNEISLPGLGIVESISAADDLDYFWYSYSSFTQPTIIYKSNFLQPAPVVFRETKTPFTPSDFVTEQVFFNTADGQRIPMFLIYKKGMVKNGENPCFLYGYGGFNISVTPSFKPERMVFLEKGGIYVVANIRGGGEYGEEWHKAGTLLNKQNVFNDFIAAAEYLISEKYTNTNKLAIHGRSNGGLLVGAVMTQRPDLFKVAIPSVGVLDMLRYHKFTIGYAWATDYGTSDEKENFSNLMSYSPYHNIKGQQYPATLITTADHDDRVVPAHSFKFGAALQKASSSENPILIRIDKNAGHGAGKPTSKLIDEWADIWAFTFKNLGMNF